MKNSLQVQPCLKHPVPEEPTERMLPIQLVCEICGKAFKVHSQFDRHMENMHGNPEKTHTRPNP